MVELSARSLDRRRDLAFASASTSSASKTDSPVSLRTLESKPRET
jgi:hypothetical protein